MIGNVSWAVIFGLAAALEIACHASTSRLPCLGTVAARIGATPLGRVALFALWAFLGFHFFSRYGTSGR